MGGLPGVSLRSTPGYFRFLPPGEGARQLRFGWIVADLEMTPGGSSQRQPQWGMKVVAPERTKRDWDIIPQGLKCLRENEHLR
jgi:hypothetical protein